MASLGRVLVTGAIKPQNAHNRRCFTASVGRNTSHSPVGFIGLGNMGAHMARNLIKKGYPVIVYDVVEKNVADITSAGAKTSSTPGEVASQVDRIITMLPSSPNVLEVYTGTDGIFSQVKSGTLMVDSSTIDPAVAHDMAKIATKKGGVYMDAPVSGGVNAARDALLTFMVGGPEAEFGAAKEILDEMGKNVIHCGAIGTGQAAKICNNMLLGISMIGTSEAMNLGMKLGLDAKMLAKVLNMSSGRCWSSEVYNPVPGVLEGVPSTNHYKGGFGTALMTKDLGLAQNAATVNKCPTPLGSLAHQLYRVMCNTGFAEKDFSSAFQFLQDISKDK